jgi:diguanylate cyclase (GGDEF)-like protein
MNPAIEAQIRLAVNFPSPPGVAGYIIELAQIPTVELDQVARAVSMDSALTAKIMRIANSPLYAQRRKSENLRQALVLLGLNATLTLALSFSLVKSLRGGKSNGLDFPLYWRRTMLAGTAARALADALHQPLAEEFFLGGLLQDVGMLVLNTAFPDLYRDKGASQHDHRALAEFERKRLDMDHAEVGAWAMRKWNLPPRICRVIEQSHQDGSGVPSDAAGIMDCCVALSGTIADLFLVDSDERPFMPAAQLVERGLGLNHEAFSRVLDKIGAIVPETEAMFDTELLSRQKAQMILEEAREVLMIRTLHSLQEVSHLKSQAESINSRALELEQENRRDALTGIYNRAHLDQVLAHEFESATRERAPLGLIFADLDRFKSINDCYGHQAGDRVLQSAARILRDNTRDTNMLARYGGEEFVIMLPATDGESTRKICERIVHAFDLARHDIGNTQIKVTISLGWATHGTEHVFASVAEFINAADQALYMAKMRGRNQAMPYVAGADRFRPGGG